MTVEIQDKPTEAPDPTATPDVDAPETQDKQPDIDAMRIQLAKLEESYAHVRQYADRTSTENAELRKLMQSQLDTAKQSMTEKEAAKAQEQFNKEWKDRLNEDPSAAVDYFQGLSQELMRKQEETTQRLIKEQLAEIQKAIEPIRAKVEENDPEYLANKDSVDQLVATGEFDRKQALKIAKIMNAGKVAQPGRVPAPGSTQPGSRVHSIGDDVAPAALDPLILRTMRDAGLSEADMKQVAIDVAKARKG